MAAVGMLKLLAKYRRWPMGAIHWRRMVDVATIGIGRFDYLHFVERFQPFAKQPCMTRS